MFVFLEINSVPQGLHLWHDGVRPINWEKLSVCTHIILAQIHPWLIQNKMKTFCERFAIKILITNDTFPYAMQHLTARVGATKRIYFPRLKPDFSRLSKHWLPIEYHVHIWQVSPQLNCCDTRQIWKWFEELNSYICQISNFLKGVMKGQGFVNLHARWLGAWVSVFICYVMGCIMVTWKFWNQTWKSLEIALELVGRVQSSSHWFESM